MTQYSGVFSLQQQGQALTSGQWATDPYFKNTTLLLHADGVANGAQNNTFLDSSTNAFSITRNGNTTQGSFTPYGSTWSNYFDGSSSFYTANNAAFQMGSGDFTIEFWANTSSFGAQTYTPICGVWNTSSPSASNAAWYVAINAYNTTTKLGFSYYTSTGTDVVFGTATNSVSSWDHYAVVRSGNLLYGFKNGVLLNAGGTAISGTLSTGGSTALTIGDLPNGNKYNGYISNLRITKGGALYTSNFTPTTTPLTTTVSAGSVSLLTCQSNRFLDNSSNAFAFTTSGTPSVQRFSPFAPQYQYTPAVIGGSGYFDGSGDYLTGSAPLSTSTSMSTFTIEGWVYPTSFANLINLFGDMDPTGPTFVIGVQITTGGVPQLYWYDGASKTCSGTTAFKLNQWNYFAFVANANALTAYVNSTTASQSGTTTLTNRTQTSNFCVGANNSSTTPNAYITDLRFSTTARTISSIPTAPLTSDANTRVLLNFTNAGIYDNAMMNDLETVGNAQVSTSVVKYGSGSLYFDGSGDYLNTAVGNLSCDLSTGDFTVECWVYFNSVSGAQFVMGRTAYNITTGAQVQYSIYTSGASLVVRPYQSTTDYSITVGTVTTGTWYHVALVRQGNTFSGFLNGVKSSTTQTISGALNNDTAWYGILLGNQQVSSANSYLNGYIDDVRITKGVARYTGNFIPPKVAFANQ